MAVVVDMQNTGDSGARAEIALVIEHVLSDRQGNGEFQLSARGRMTTGNLKSRDRKDSNGHTRSSAPPASTSPMPSVISFLSCYRRAPN